MTRKRKSKQEINTECEKESERCSVCRSFVKRQGIQCDECDIWHHRGCVKLTKAEFQDLQDENKTWLCPSCNVYRQSHQVISSESEAEEPPSEVYKRPEPVTNAANFFLTPARILASADITTPRRQLPPIPIEQWQNISLPNESANDFDLNLNALSPFSSLHPGRERLSQENLNFHKLSATSHSEPMEIDTPSITKPDTSPAGVVSIQQSSKPQEPSTHGIDSQVKAGTPFNTTTTEKLLEVLCELSETQQLLENAAPPPHPISLLRRRGGCAR